MLVGVVGLAGAGKDTVGNILCDAHGYVKDSFAASLKDVCSTLFGWDRAMMEGDTVASRMWREQTDEWWAKKLDIEGFSPRKAMQLLGTDAMRHHFHPDIWRLTLENRLRLSTSPKTVISDCRFPNEIQLIRDMGGEIWRIRRGEDPSWYYDAVSANNGNEVSHNLMRYHHEVHESEWLWIDDNYDVVINNDKSLYDLGLQINKTLYNV